MTTLCASQCKRKNIATADLKRGDPDYHSNVFKIYFFENHVHTLTELSFYTGPKDTADPVDLAY